ncbi:MAG: hypothetical protein GXP31_01110 [Kiritimatiellaeota bacterium]|nr:hypothetical protein [Kiritimatiellota bacterium]
MIGFQPFSPPLFLWAWLIVLGAALALTAHRLRTALQPGRRALIFALRMAAAVLIFLFLLRPYREKERPDPSRFRVALLTDCSASI